MKKAFLLLSSVLLLFSCQKDTKTEEPVKTPTQTNTEKVTGKNFKVTALSLSLPVGNVDMYSQLKDCEKDNIYTFATPNLYKEDEGSTKCNEMDNQTSTGTWAWQSNETEMAITAGGISWTWKVLTNDGSTLKVSVKKDTMGLSGTLITTMTKQ